jgi:hypothetical protein
VKRIEAAKSEYRRSHWGDRGDGAVSSQEIADSHDGPFVVLGRLVSIAYETTKGGECAVWEHDFGHNGPDLCYHPKSKRLIIAGGDYTVTRRGIEG